MTKDCKPYLAWLEIECGYSFVRPLSDGRWAAIMPLKSTAAIIVGRIGNVVYFDDRWCYHTTDGARAALDTWDGQGEPSGWHRHPLSGRRVTADGQMENLD